ncbi:unnamed protein product [Durusdinium trenchii]|uniref:Uncharacterized protein n=2 Tax=Durusdinium trenchii TaxID=1381693 RepID=A0ABP0QFS0_9DINO
MWWRWWLLFTQAAALAGPWMQAKPQLEVLHQWVEMEFEWPNATARETALQSQKYRPEHNVLAGLKVCGPEVASRCTHQMIFVTVPRWATGVPASLNLLTDSQGQAKLQPWPSMEAQDPQNCSNIQYVQSMEIDPQGVMWVVDVGRKYFTETSDDKCPPKILLIDIPSGDIIDSYVFPDEVAPYTGSFLNDIVLDVEHQMAYISSTGNTPADKGAIIVYDRANKRSRRIEDRSTHAEHGARLVIHSTDYSKLLEGLPVDGIALTPDGERIFYSALGGTELYSISAAKARNFSVNVSSVLASVDSHGKKSSNSDGMTFGADGFLYFGGLTMDSLLRWKPGTPLNETQQLAVDHEKLWWIDTFAWDNRGNLWLTSNRLNSWFFRDVVPPAMDFTGSSGANFRILKIPVGSNSYMYRKN